MRIFKSTQIGAWLLLAAFVFAFSNVEAQSESDKKVHFFSFSHLKSSLRHELGFSMGAHVVKSPQVATYRVISNNWVYPEPVFNRAIGIFSMSYEPKFRLIEVGSALSLSLDLPLTASLSTVDVRTKDAFQVDAATLTDPVISQRSAALGWGHVEGGGILSINLLQGSTYENTAGIGLSAGLGAIFVYAPLVMNPGYGFLRSDYAGMTNWVTPVGRFGLHFRGVVLHYTIGVLPTKISYQSGNSLLSRSTYVNTYNKFTLAFRLGR